MAKTVTDPAAANAQPQAGNENTGRNARATRPARYEGSAADDKQDKAGAKKLGVSQAAYEKTAKDKKEDKAGQKKIDRVAQAHADKKKSYRELLGDEYQGDF